MASLGLVLDDFRGPTILLGVVEFLTMLSLFYKLDEGRVAKDRAGRSWRTIAAEAWGTDILRERSFMYLVGSRFFILGGSAFLIALAVPYLERALGMADPDDRAVWILAITGIAALCTAVATIPAARLSQRYGRKRLIYAAAATSATGMVICAFAPSVWLLVVGASLVGVGGGSFLAVDWALMTDIIPLAASGRYMGIANIANAISGPLAIILVGPVMDAFTRAGATETGPRVAIGLGVVALAGAAALLIGVRPRRGPDALSASVVAGTPPAP
jgi:MFS family permease